MGKMMSYSLISIFIIELALFYFSGTNVATTGLFAALTNPASILTNGWYLAMLGIISVTIAASVIPSFIIQANQWAYFAVGCVVFITYVQAYARFAGFIAGSLSGLGAEGVSTVGLMNLSPFTVLATVLITSPLIILYVTAMVEWTRFNQ